MRYIASVQEKDTAEEGLFGGKGYNLKPDGSEGLAVQMFAAGPHGSAEKPSFQAEDRGKPQRLLGR